MFLAFVLFVMGPFFSSSNYAADLLGPLDFRLGCWGVADFTVKTVIFTPPVGHRVRITRLRGDLIAWPRVLPGEEIVKEGTYAGVLLGFQTSAPEGSVRSQPYNPNDPNGATLPMADNTMLYVQGALDKQPVRVDFNHAINALLEPDHKLLVKVAAWLNTTGKPIHLEPSFTVEYQFEKEDASTER